MDATSGTRTGSRAGRPDATGTASSAAGCYSTAFVDICTRLDRPDRRIAIGDVHAEGPGLELTYRVIDPHRTTLGKLQFERTKSGLRLAALE